MRKLTLVGKERLIRRGLEQELRQIKLDMANALKNADDRHARLVLTTERDAKVIADLRVALVGRDETIERMKLSVVTATNERDRLVRIIDQFTSVAILPMHSAALGGVGTISQGNSPKELRRT